MFEQKKYSQLEKTPVLKVTSSQPSAISEGKSIDFSKTTSTISEQNKSKGETKFDKKSNNRLSCISEQTSGFGSFKVHRYESIDEELEQFGDLPEEQITLAKKKISNLHGRNFGRSMTLDDSIVAVANRSKLKIVAVLLVIGLAILFFSILDFSSTDKPKKRKLPGEKEKRSKKAGKEKSKRK